MIPTKLSVGHRSAEPYNRLDYMTKIIYIKKAIRSYNTLAYNFLKKYLCSRGFVIPVNTKPFNPLNLSSLSLTHYKVRIPI